MQTVPVLLLCLPVPQETEVDVDGESDGDDACVLHGTFWSKVRVLCTFFFLFSFPPPFFLVNRKAEFRQAEFLVVSEACKGIS